MITSYIVSICAFRHLITASIETLARQRFFDPTWEPVLYRNNNILIGEAKQAFFDAEG
jgi:hypothetical protein